MPTALIAPAIGLVGSVASSIIGSNASKAASQQEQQAQQQVIANTGQAVTGGQAGVTAATGQANDTLGASQQKQLDLFQPYIGAGTDSLTSLQQLAGKGGPLDQQFSFNPSDLQTDPGYAFTLSEGQKAIQRAAAAKGGLFSGSTLKSLAGYTTGTANQYFNDAFQRAQSTFDTNRQTALSRIGSLQNLAQLGYGGTQGAAGAVNSTSAQQAQNTFGAGEFNSNTGITGARIVGDALSNRGNAQAAGTVGSANSIIGGIQQGNKSIQDFLAQRAARNAAAGTASSTIAFPSAGGPP